MFKTNRITVYFNPDEQRFLKVKAIDRGVSVTDMVSSIVLKELGYEGVRGKEYEDKK